MGKIYFGLNVVAAIYKFKMDACTKIPNVISTCLIVFLDPENVGVATKIKYWNIGKTKFDSNGWRPFWNDEARVGVLIICSVWSSELAYKIQLVVIFSGYTTQGANAPVLLRLELVDGIVF